MTIEDTMRSYRGGGGLYSNAVRFCDDLKNNLGPYLDNNGLPLVLADGDWAIVKTNQMHLNQELWVDSWEKELVLGDEDSYRMIVHMSNGESWVFNFKLYNDRRSASAREFWEKA